jgi:hypothetical protein
MRKYFLIVASLFLWANAAFVNLADEFDWVPDSAEYQGASWDNLVKIERGLSLEEAYKIAYDNSEIGYFFYTVGWSMVLDTPRGLQYFGPGDTAFFSGKPWWGSAEGLAHGYVKKN